MTVKKIFLISLLFGFLASSQIAAWYKIREIEKHIDMLYAAHKNLEYQVDVISGAIK
jgi:hypothetical protein